MQRVNYSQIYRSTKHFFWKSQSQQCFIIQQCAALRSKNRFIVSLAVKTLLGGENFTWSRSENRTQDRWMQRVNYSLIYRSTKHFFLEIIESAVLYNTAMRGLTIKKQVHCQPSGLQRYFQVARRESNPGPMDVEGELTINLPLDQTLFWKSSSQQCFIIQQCAALR